MEFIRNVLDQPILDKALEIWESGGWAMIALAVNALILFVLGVNMWLGLKGRGFSGLSAKKWQQQVLDPKARKGAVGELIDFVMRSRDIDEIGRRFDELGIQELEPVARDLRFMRRAVSTAPLMGLLGTVTGMLTTFQGLATGGGGDKTLDVVAGGISEALITTETGLVIAVPGLFFHYYLTRQRDKYQAFLAHLQTFCTQTLYRQARQARAAS